MAEVFSAFTQANLRNRILKKKQTSLDNLSPKNTGGSSSQFDIKDDIILVQFKLVNKETDKTFNTFSILNVPLTSYLDMNISNLHEILIK